MEKHYKYIENIIYIYIWPCKTSHFYGKYYIYNEQERINGKHLKKKDSTRINLKGSIKVYYLQG